MARSIVCLTFDFDAISGWIARGMTSPSPISRGEFGPHVGVPRILELLKRDDIVSSWYIPGHTLETYPDQCRRVADAGHEVGHHGWTHRPPATLSREQEEEELVRANEAIRRLTGRVARGYRSPSWDLSPHSVELLLKHGFVYDSSMMADDYIPYRVREGDVITLDKAAVFGRS
ncbi:MAG TPA: polysaccharide deacetylase family protein, partial [Burkholderiales bacterium]|nr:polysaccharide deacetylase family protein [Burkholderiales bacterium]